MDRRTFIRSSAQAGVATGIGVLAAQSPAAVAAGAADRDVDLFRELFAVVDRRSAMTRKPNGEATHVKVGDAIHQMHLLALIHARNWAHEVGFDFTWELPENPVDPDYPWRCCARLNGELLEYDDTFTFVEAPNASASDRAEALYGEGSVSLSMLQQFISGSRDDQSNAEFVDAPNGKIAVERW